MNFKFTTYLKSIGFELIVSLIVVILIIYSMNNIQLSSKLGSIDLKDKISEYTEIELTPISLATMTEFEWDKLCIIPPYTSKSDLNKRLGIIWVFGPSLDHDQLQMLVFMNKGKVVSYSILDRSIYDFLEHYTGEYVPSDNKFSE